MVRRWHFWACFQGEERDDEAQACIHELSLAGYKGRICAPLPQHKTSGHVHVVCLIDKEELWAWLRKELEGIKDGE